MVVSDATRFFSVVLCLISAIAAAKTSSGDISPRLIADYQHFFAGSHDPGDYVDEDGEVKENEVYQWRAYKGVRRSLVSRILYDLGVTRSQKIGLLVSIVVAIWLLRGRYKPKWRRPLFSGGATAGSGAPVASARGGTPPQQPNKQKKKGGKKKRR